MTVGNSTELSLDVIESCLAFCAGKGSQAVVLAIPNAVSKGEIDALLSRPQLKGVVVKQGSAAGDDAWAKVGYFIPEDYNWKLPQVKATTVAYLAPRREISFRMVTKALLQGVFWLVYASPGEWRREHTLVFLLVRIRERLMIEVENCYRRIRKPIRRVYRTAVTASLKRYGSTPQVNAFARLLARKLQPLVLYLDRRYERPFTTALQARCVPLLAPHEFVPGRIVLTNASLAWGGAERQVVNTLTGLKRRGHGDLLLLCEHLHDRPEHDFFYWQLENEGIKAREIRRIFDIPSVGNNDAIAELARAMDDAPKNLRDDILAFVVEFLESKPEIIHAWQDSTSIKAGYAAALVGVPNIILNGRNMAPYNFAYFLPYMRRAYAVLSRRPNVRFINNSRAGAADYEGWLDLVPGTVNVLFNGLHGDTLKPVTGSQQQEYRRQIGIPEHARVVGSIFRLYEEKGPLLWVQTAALVAKKVPDAVFLLVGKGPFAERIREEAASHGIGDRIFMPGTEQRAELPLSVMDVFLLTSRLEGTPNVCIEAQWMGVPVVAPDVGGTGDTVLNGETGWIVNPRNKRLLAEKVISVLEDEGWSAEARRRAPVFARERFGFNRMIDDSIMMYGLEKAGTQGDATQASGHGLESGSI